MRRKKIGIAATLICIICILIVIIVCVLSKTQKKNIVKIGIIDSYISKDILDSMNITNINYTTYDKLYSSFRNKIFGIF